VLSALPAEIPQLRVLVLEQSVTVATSALAEDVMTDFMDYRVHWIYRALTEQF